DRVVRFERAANDDGAEAVELAQLVLPVDQRFQLALALDVEPVDDILRDHHEQRQVDGVDAFTKDGPLSAALTGHGLGRAGSAEEGVGVLEVVARHDPAERLARLEHVAVAGVDIADLALGNGDERHSVDAVLPAPQAKVHAAAQDLVLKAGLTVHRDYAAF